MPFDTLHFFMTLFSNDCLLTKQPCSTIIILKHYVYIRKLNIYSRPRNFKLEKNDNIGYEYTGSCHQTLVGESKSCMRGNGRMIFQLSIQNTIGLNAIIWNFIVDNICIQSIFAWLDGIDQTLSRLGKEDYSPHVKAPKTEEAWTDLEFKTRTSIFLVCYSFKMFTLLYQIW